MKIKELRQKLKLSQYEVANKLGMPQTTFHYYEVGRNEPNIETLIKIADFFISASPLLAALILLRKQFFNNYKLFLRYLFGNRPQLLPYTITILIFVFQFFTFHFFGMPHESIPIKKFFSALQFQIIFGGGLEEGGWRGYLQPALEKKFSVFKSTMGVGIIWALWHIPYFFIPGYNQHETSFLIYLITCIILAFTLTAIYKLTKSILICTLFHGFVNTLAVTIGPDLSNPWFSVMLIIQAVISIAICSHSSHLCKDS